MKTAYFDCFSGISGDMVVGALVDAGLDLSRLEGELRRLALTDWSISAEKVRRGALAATKVNVVSGEHHHHRSLAKILELIDAAGFPERVATRARSIFGRLGTAEAKVHGISIEKVHFHEVGAVDAIIDIVGATLGFEMLGLEEFFTSPLNLGAGHVQTAHGLLPVPAPATGELVCGFGCYSSGIQRELVTPTGAAIISTLATASGPMPEMTIEAVGVGAGSADLTEQPNVLRLFIGERAAAQEARWNDEVAVIEATVDDMNPQLYGFFAEQALKAGARDVFSVAAQMKKNRPGQLVTVLAEPRDTERLVDLIFRETTTLGVRISRARRRALEREWKAVETGYGTVRIKLARVNGRLLNAAPEYEDCRRLALERGVPLKTVLAEALARYRQETAEGEL